MLQHPRTSPNDVVLCALWAQLRLSPMDVAWGGHCNITNRYVLCLRDQLSARMFSKKIFSGNQSVDMIKGSNKKAHPDARIFFSSIKLLHQVRWSFKQNSARALGTAHLVVNLPNCFAILNVPKSTNVSAVYSTHQIARLDIFANLVRDHAVINFMNKHSTKHIRRVERGSRPKYIYVYISAIKALMHVNSTVLIFVKSQLCNTHFKKMPQ